METDELFSEGTFLLGVAQINLLYHLEHRSVDNLILFYQNVPRVKHKTVSIPECDLNKYFKINLLFLLTESRVSCVLYFLLVLHIIFSIILY